ncbi:MAG: phage portal protein [Planctomycetota bacterium]
MLEKVREKFAAVIYPTNRIGDPATGLAPMSEAQAMGIPAFFSGVSFLALTLATLPVHIRRKTAKGREAVPTHGVQKLVSESPSSLTSAAVFWETLFGHAVSWGNGYGLIVRDRSGRPAELLNMPPHLVTPMRVDGETWYVIRVDGDEPTVIAARDMLHLPGLGYDGLCGYNPIRLLADALQLGRTAQRWGTSFFDNGARLGGVIESKRGLKDEQITDIRNQIQQHYSGPDKAGKWLILGGEATAKTLSAPPETAQLIETLQLSEHQICQILRVPPIHVYDFGRATWGNAVEMDRHTVQYSLRPWIVKAEQEARRKLFSVGERDRGLYLQFSVEGLLRGDPKTRMETARLELSEGLASVNEKREQEDRPRIDKPWADAYRVPANAMPATRLTEPTPEPAGEVIPIEQIIEESEDDA